MKDKYRVDRNKQRLKKWNNAKLKSEMPKYKSGDLVNKWIKEWNKIKNVQFYKNISSACFKSDLIIIHTEWNVFKLLNFKNLVKKKNFSIYDMRNIYSPSKMKQMKIEVVR